MTMTDRDFRGMCAKDLAELLTAPEISGEQVIHVTDAFLVLDDASNDKVKEGYWDSGRRLESIKKILLASNILPTYTVSKLLEDSMRDPSIYHNRKLNISKLFIRQHNISAQALLHLAQWVSPYMYESVISVDYAKSINKSPSLLGDILNHLNFPSEEIGRLCLSPNADVRRVASESRGCPEEGKVAVALLNQDAY